MNKIFSFLFLIIMLAACNSGQEEEKIKPATMPVQYYYYPRANVYFDSANKDFIFLANDGRTWQTAKQIPAAMQGIMDKSVFINQPGQPVWKDNQNHQLVYSSVLYASPADTVAQKPEPVVEKKPAVEKKKEKKGIGKFLDKIFGKKKKD